jgi:hypothetical protein
MLKLQVSLSWMMSRRAAAMRRERARVERCGMCVSLESGVEQFKGFERCGWGEDGGGEEE